MRAYARGAAGLPEAALWVRHERKRLQIAQRYVAARGRASEQELRDTILRAARAEYLANAEDAHRALRVAGLVGVDDKAKRQVRALVRDMVKDDVLAQDSQGLWPGPAAAGFGGGE